MSSSNSQVKSNKMAKKTETVPAPAVAVKAPAKTSKKSAPAQAEVVVPTTAAPVVVAAPVEVRTSDAILTSLQETLKTLSSEMSTRLRAAVHEAQESVKAIKREARESKRRRKVDPATLTPEERVKWEARRANNAFLKARPLTDELCTFMGLPAKSMKSQADVTKFVSAYVKSHNCFDPTFKRRILPDAKLAKLLRVSDKDEVTYLNLQSFLKVHFIKPVVVA